MGEVVGAAGGVYGQGAGGAGEELGHPGVFAAGEAGVEGVEDGLDRRRVGREGAERGVLPEHVERRADVAERPGVAASGADAARGHGEEAAVAGIATVAVDEHQGVAGEGGHGGVQPLGEPGDLGGQLHAALTGGEPVGLGGAQRVSGGVDRGRERGGVGRGVQPQGEVPQGGEDRRRAVAFTQGLQDPPPWCCFTSTDSAATYSRGPPGSGPKGCATGRVSARVRAEGAREVRGGCPDAGGGGARRAGRLPGRGPAGGATCGVVARARAEGGRNRYGRGKGAGVPWGGRRQRPRNPGGDGV